MGVVVNREHQEEKRMPTCAAQSRPFAADNPQMECAYLSQFSGTPPVMPAELFAEAEEDAEPVST